MKNEQVLIDAIKLLNNIDIHLMGSECTHEKTGYCISCEVDEFLNKPEIESIINS